MSASAIPVPPPPGQERRLLEMQSRRFLHIPVSELLVDSEIEIYPDIQTKGLFFLQFDGARLRLTAGPYIGLIPINSRIVVEVRPKLPVRNLSRVIELAQQHLVTLETFERLYDVSEQHTASILELLAGGLIRALAPIRSSGLEKLYVPTTHNDSSPRGKINFTATLRRNFSRGLFHRMVSSRFEMTADTPHNQLIKFALWLAGETLIRVRSRNRHLLEQLNGCLLDFGGVSLKSFDQEGVRRVQHTSGQLKSKASYDRAIEIAGAIVAGDGVELVRIGDELRLSSYIINFEVLYEAYVRQVLRCDRDIANRGFAVLDGNKEGRRRLFEESDTPPAQPDIVIVDNRKRPLIVLEVKYKDRPERADINQAIAYGLAYGVRSVVLIHQSELPEDPPWRLIGTIGGITILRYSINLDCDDLELEERAFSRRMLDLASAQLQ